MSEKIVDWDVKHQHKQTNKKKIVFLFLNQNSCCGYSKKSQLDIFLSITKHLLKLRDKEIINIFTLKIAWVKDFRVNPEFRILRPTFYGKSASKC